MGKGASHPWLVAELGRVTGDGITYAAAGTLGNVLAAGLSA